MSRKEKGALHMPKRTAKYAKVSEADNFLLKFRKVGGRS
jgi:hypothetical protein